MRRKPSPIRSALLFLLLFNSIPAMAATFEGRVDRSAGDAEERVSNGSMALTGALNIVYSGSYLQLVGVWFPNVTIPNGAVITNAYIQFRCSTARSGNTTYTIEGNAADTASTFTTSSRNITNRSRTEASATWTTGSWTLNNNYQTSNLSGVVGEIVNRDGWESGNAMAFIISGSGTARKDAYAYDGSSSNAPLLHIDYTPSTATHTVRFQAGTGGSISGTATQTVIHNGSTTAVTAVASSGYRFTGWTGDFTGTTNPLTITNVRRNMTITANFVRVHTVTFIAGTGGSISGTATQTVDHGGSCTAVTAVAGTGYQFANWSGSYSGTANPLTVTNVTAGMSITANFTPRTYTVTVTSTPGGRTDKDGTHTVSHGATFTITPTPDPGNRFASWSGSASGSSSPLAIIVTSNLSITANFEKMPTSLPYCDDFDDNNLLNPGNWLLSDNDNAPSGTYFSETDGQLHIFANGTDVWTGNDEYASAYLYHINGNFEAIVKVVSQGNTNDWAKAGIMVKNDLAAPGASTGYVMTAVTPGHGYTLQWDGNANGYLDGNINNGSTVTSTYPCYLKLVKQGTVFSGYYSTDGSNWTLTGTVTIPSAITVQDVGLFVTSHASGSMSLVKFDDFCIRVPPAMTTNFTGYIDPPDARTNGRWRLYNVTQNRYEVEAWQSHGQTVTIPYGDTYRIEWQDITNWNTPAPVTRQIPQQAISWTGIYTPVSTTTTTISTTSTTTVSSTTTTTVPGVLCVDIADIPLDTQLQPAPANIMFVIDDSGSMDWEILTSGAVGDGLFSVGGTTYEYIFDDAGDNAYSTSSSNGTILTGYNRGYWQSQWFDFNKMYYNPGVTYDPWPSTATYTLGNADLYNPPSNPVNSSATLTMADVYQTLTPGVIVNDHDDPNFSKTGPDWREYSSSSEAYGRDYYYTYNAGTYTATWSANLQSGQYEVYARWASGTNRSTSVSYTVNHAGGSTTIPPVNQTQNAGQWYLLGTFSFDEGTGSVNLSHTVTSSGGNRACADAIWFAPMGGWSIDVKNAHYYVKSNGNIPYLIVLDGSIRYYRFSNSDALNAALGGLLEDSDPPDEIIPKNSDGTARTYSEELQNFTNWYSFYRRRELTAKAAVSKVITEMQGVQIGLHTIHQRINQPVLKIKVREGLLLTDETDSLLDLLYAYNSNDSTPLRLALNRAGQYYHANDGQTGGIGVAPWAEEAAGGACQQSFTILMTDGYYNDSVSGIGNVDGDNGVPYADSVSNSLADIAMKYYENDLHSTLANMVPTNQYDSASYQHMVTYGVSFGVFGNLDPGDYDLYNINPANRTYPTWPDPINDNQDRIDDLWHATVNGRGKFLSAGNPQEMINALKDIMQSIVSRIGSGASVTINGDELSDGRVMFQSSYSSDGWTGDVKAYDINADTGVVELERKIWSAGEKLGTLNWDTGRKIATYTGAAGIPFRHNQLTAAQQAILNLDKVNFLRGNAAKEVGNPNGIFRQRSSKLGDIVHSSPLLENGIVYAGANDGMLHAFDAATGNEVFAYVPNHVFPNLPHLTDPNYVHKYYVDLTPYARSTGSQTLLVGGLGKGGKGVYCLDVTNPRPATESALAAMVKWEYPRTGTPAADVADMGYTFSRPFLVNSNAGVWVVIFGNGYASPNQSGVLYILNATDGTLLKKIDTGVGGCNGLSTPMLVDVNNDHKVDYVYAGDLRGNLWKFDLTAQSAASWSVAYKSGGTPKPLFQAKGPSGSLEPITTKPDVARHCDPKVPGYLVAFGTGRYLGTSDLTEAGIQTIYGVWDYGDDSDDSEYLGSFERSSVQLSNQPGTVSLLAQTQIYYDDDNASGKLLRVLSNNAPVWKTQADSTAGQKPNPSSTEANNAGWYFDLPISKERVVRDIMIRDGKVIAITSVPKDSPCEGGGDSIVMEMDLCKGGRLARPQFDLQDDGEGHGTVNNNDMITITVDGQQVTVAPTGRYYQGMIYPPPILRNDLTEIKYFSSSTGTIFTMTEQAERRGMYYWRQVEE